MKITSRPRGGRYPFRMIWAAYKGERAVMSG